MELENCVVSEQGLLQRGSQSVKGACCGCCVWMISVLLLGWNEFNFVRNQHILEVVRKETREVSCTPDHANDGRPVATSCQILKVYDFKASPDFPPAGQLPAIEGNVSGAWFRVQSQIYQWVESKECESYKEGTKKVTKCTFDYSAEWVSSAVDSNSFRCFPNNKTGCMKFGEEIQNRGSIPPVLQRTWNAKPDSITMGDASKNGSFALNSGMLSVFPPKPVKLRAVQGALEEIPKFRAYDIDAEAGLLYYGAPPKAKKDHGGDDEEEQDHIGDLKVELTVSDVTPGFTRVSVLAKQAPGASPSDARLVQWDTHMSGTMSWVNWIFLEYMSKEDILAEKKGENEGQVFILRIIGFALMWWSFRMITGPLALAPEAVPFCGDMLAGLVGSALCCATGAAAAAVSLVVIGCCWVLARPLFGIAMLLCAGLPVVLLVRTCRKNKAAREATRVASPLPQPQEGKSENAAYAAMA